ncbi:MAG: spore germination protein [Clostridiales bacterium]|nr:spore germination protein [Clostridiales bacterium]MCF8021873.1 spore germination protein [Clostridiales bacterium]
MKRFKKLVKNITNKYTKANNKKLNNKGDKPGRKLFNDLDRNMDTAKDKLGRSMDLVVREFKVGHTRGALLCINGLVNKSIIDNHILETLMVHSREVEPNPVGDGKKLLQFIKNNTIAALQYEETHLLDDVLTKVLLGYTALYIDGLDSAVLINTIGFEMRAIEEPQTEAVVRGPREGFTENLQLNISMLRRKIRSPELRLESKTLGRFTGTPVCIAYIDGIVNEKIVEEVRERLQQVDIDGILESGYIEDFIEDAPYSIFPTVGNTEKPDVLAAKLLEGRVGILVDGTPMVLTVPYVFIETIQSSEDYYARWASGIVMRMLRILGILITTQLPALYVATISYNPEVMPTILVITVAASREGIPLPATAEMLILGLIFEILREAGIRQPRPVGQAVSIVGALVIGEAAMKSGLVSSPAVMVTVLTGIASFVAPAQGNVYVHVRLFLLFVSAVTGFLGFFIGNLVLLTHLVSLRSFGVPYMSPLGPSNYKGWKDVYLRVPMWAMIDRPGVINWKKQQRVNKNVNPGPPKNEIKKEK